VSWQGIVIVACWAVLIVAWIVGRLLAIQAHRDVERRRRRRHA
jgi:hypothetical protein